MADEQAEGASRRTFLVGAGAAGLAGVALSNAVWAAPALAQAAGEAPGAAPNASAAAAAAAGAAGLPSVIDLTLDGAASGRLLSTEGGNVTADVITEKLGSDYFQKKHIGQPKYEDFAVQCGTGMSKGFYNWIKASFDGKPEQRNGSVKLLNIKGQGTSLDFTNALLTEIGFPALDAAAKDAAKMTIKFSPEVTRMKAASGAPQGTVKGQKQWLPSNFRLEIQGLDCTKVSKIDAFTVKQTIVTDQVGDARTPTRHPAKVEIPDLRVELPLSSADTWFQWLDDFVVKGNSGDDQERGGSLTFLAPDNTTPLFVLTFKHLGIFKVAPDKAEAGAEGVRRVKAELYCEQMVFEPKVGF